MSIPKEDLEQYLHEAAVFCCQFPKGKVITADELIEPTLFDDMLDADLMPPIPKEALKIGQILGKTLAKDAVAMTAALPDVIVESLEELKIEDEKGEIMSNTKKEKNPNVLSGGNIKLEIGKLENLKLDLSFNALSNIFSENSVSTQGNSLITAENSGEKTVIRKLLKQHIKINEVKLGTSTSIQNHIITIDKNLAKKAIKEDILCKDIKLDIIKPNERHIYTDTIMDVCPIATKVEGKLGEGITKIIDGVVFMLTGVDEDGVQVHEFGSSHGYLDEKMYFGNPGCADENDIIIRCHVTIKKLSGMSRPGPFAAHKCQDYIIQAVRDELKKYEGEIVREEICEDIRRKGNPRIVLIKEIMGQGAMHDNVLCPTEPCGIAGGQKNVDCGNVPIMLTPNQVRDGSIHALTCIGPATKEMTRHYIREPLVEGLAKDQELDLVGVIFVGSPQVNDEKLWVSERLGSLLESSDIDGCIITTEGFGNNHIDFIEHIGQAGERGIPVVGVSFCAYQGQLVVGNKYATAMVEENMDAGGFENDVAGTSCVTKDVAMRSIQMLKNQMSGVKILPAKKKWDHEVINENNKLLGLPEVKLLDSGTHH